MRNLVLLIAILTAPLAASAFGFETLAGQAGIAQQLSAWHAINGQVEIAKLERDVAKTFYENTAKLVAKKSAPKKALEDAEFRYQLAEGRIHEMALQAKSLRAMVDLQVLSQRVSANPSADLMAEISQKLSEIQAIGRQAIESKVPMAERTLDYYKTIYERSQKLAAAKSISESVLAQHHLAYRRAEIDLATLQNQLLVYQER